MRVYGVTGWKNSGKTVLMERLVADLTGRGLTVSTVKHAHHAFDVDQSGKDSHRHRSAGAAQVLVASRNRWALMSELRGAPEPGLAALLRRLDPVDLVIVEGFKRDSHPKLEVHRGAIGKPWIHPEDPFVLAIASDVAPPPGPLPRAHLDDIAAIADLVLARAMPLATGMVDCAAS